MPAEQELFTFATAVEYYQEDASQHTLFDAACCAFLAFDQSALQSARLTVLYILYGLYADLPLEKNPFLAFFIDLIDTKADPNDDIEQHFVYCILEGTIQNIKDLVPQAVCDDPSSLPPIHHLAERLTQLKSCVSTLVDDPCGEKSMFKATDSQKDTKPVRQSGYVNQVEYLSQQMEKITSQTELDKDIVEFIRELTASACVRTLTIPENEVLMHAFHTHPEMVDICGLKPEFLPRWIELNLLLASDITPMFLKRPNFGEYLQALLNVPVSGHSLDVIHHLVTCANPCHLPDEFLHMYISNSILSCELLAKGPWQDRQVKLVAKFIQSLLEKKIIRMSEYLVEIQSFCVGYLRFKGVAILFRMVSSEAQKAGYEIGRARPTEQLAGPSLSNGSRRSVV
ncbi:hypothetical protein CLU79DRAFT_756076 [Phycomyces nitens]|nr:hypothetical protein CLU79DRAFT_756076 [Phycomyces nitens]